MPVSAKAPEDASRTFFDSLTAAEPGRPAADIVYGRFGRLVDADTTAALRIYDFAPLIADYSPLDTLLEQCGVTVKCFSSVTEAVCGAALDRKSTRLNSS